jgi:uncharacterized membrane protein
MESALVTVTSYAALILETIAVAVVFGGGLDAFVRLLGVLGRQTHGARKEVWRRFGSWLLLGLEFELAADIIRTVVSPEWQDIGELGAIAVIRTFLNYFLEKDLEHAQEQKEAGLGEAT